ncbi:hypothetical protein DFJ58DRAFT_761334, partial [Suillus subalutaceus]|uniref:uncharacterized protein n=1 Tax=Suillus subalutaceus TaxID=48586 RepID=UPI001B884C75
MILRSFLPRGLTFPARILCPPTHLPFSIDTPACFGVVSFFPLRRLLPSSRNSRPAFSRSEGFVFSLRSARSRHLVDSEHRARKPSQIAPTAAVWQSQTFPTDYEGETFVVQTLTSLDIISSSQPPISCLPLRRPFPLHRLSPSLLTPIRPQVQFHI